MVKVVELKLLGVIRISWSLERPLDYFSLFLVDRLVKFRS